MTDANLACLIVHKLNMALIDNISMFTARLVEDQRVMEEIKQRNERAQAEYEHLRKAHE